MDQKITYNKDQKLEEIDNKIADILSEAIYSYIIRKGLLKRRIPLISNSEHSNPNLSEKNIDNDEQI